MLKNLRQALRINPRFGSPVNRDYMRNLLKELEPQHGVIRRVQNPGVDVNLSTTPLKLSIFDTELNYNDQILADHTNDSLTIQNTNGVFPSGYYEQFGAGLSGAGMMAKLFASATFTSPASRRVLIEVYIDGVASGIIFRFPTQSGGDKQSTIVRTFHIPDGVELTFYIYCATATMTVNFTNLAIRAEKVPLGVDLDAVTTFAEV